MPPSQQASLYLQILANLPSADMTAPQLLRFIEENRFILKASH